MKIKKVTLLFLIILIALLSFSLASASAIDIDADSSDLNGLDIKDTIKESCPSSNVLDNALDNQDDLKTGLKEGSSQNLKFDNEISSLEYDCQENKLTLSIENVQESKPNLKSTDFEEGSSNSSDSNEADKSFTITQSNLFDYFDYDGVLKSEYGDSILIFEGRFEDIGLLIIDKNNTKITGKDSLFYNTVFKLTGSEIMLANLNFVLDKSFPINHDAGIFIGWDNITVFNVTMNYTSPPDMNAIGIYSEDNFGLNLINNTINFIGHADFTGYNYGIMLNNSYDAYVYNNIIYADLPLRDVDWNNGIHGSVWMEKVSAFAAGECDNLRFSNNQVYSTINHGVYAQSRYPTLSSVLIYACNNATINNNIIKIDDFNTKKDEANYLYGLDIYKLDDATIVNNTINIFTIGGTEIQGTAYPIQVTGPANNIKIAYNNITSFCFGPNIGIYSQNYFGATNIDIISNFINITGKAGTHPWSLVAGIEVQDSDDKILNNTIIVDSVGGFQEGTRLYGISYSQGTNGLHQYDIMYNHIITPNSIAVSLNEGLGSNTSNSRIIYNNFETSNGDGGDSAARIGGYGINNTIQNNTQGADPAMSMTEDELPDWLREYLNSTYIRFFDLNWLEKKNNDGQGMSNNSSNAGSGFVNNQSNGKPLINNPNSRIKNNGLNLNPSASNASNGDLNSSRYTVGTSGVTIASASASQEAGNGLKEVKKSYSIEKEIRIEEIENNNQIILLVLIAIGLMIIGYYYKKYTEEG